MIVNSKYDIKFATAKPTAPNPSFNNKYETAIINTAQIKLKINPSHISPLLAKTFPKIFPIENKTAERASRIRTDHPSSKSLPYSFIIGTEKIETINVTNKEMTKLIFILTFNI